MVVQSELYLDSVSRVEVLSGPTGRRRWPDEVKCQLVAESLGVGVTVREVAERHGIAPNRLSTWRSLAKRGKLHDPSLVSSAPEVPTFANIILDETTILPLKKVKPLEHIELETGGVILRLDLDTNIDRIANLVFALKVAP
ncbi:MAG: transposase [Rhizobiales bacterium]|nr:transposase [Hyphomicrobiales bacterium]